MAQELMIFETTTPASLSPALIQKQHQWPIIARDLALLASPQMGSTYGVEDIAIAYGITIAEMQVLISLPAFQNFVKEEKAKIDSNPHGGNRLRSEIMAMDMQEVLYLRSKEGNISDKVMLNFLEYLSRVCGLDSGKEKNTAVNQNTISVTVNVPRLNNPKLAHLYPVEELEYDGE